MKIKAWIRYVVPETIVALRWRVVNRLKYGSADHQEIFTKIYQDNEWGDKESVSGSGSTIEVTAVFRKELEAWLVAQDIKSFVDIPCGDFNWMKLVKLPPTMTYYGMDIVPGIIEDNKRKYSCPNVEFHVGDILGDKLRRADAYLCKDLFIHFPNKAISEAVENVRASGTRYLLATTFPNTKTNIDIRFGSARRTNLALILGKPQTMLRDFGAGVTDRFIGVWDLQAAPQG